MELFLVKVNSHKSANGIVASLAARIARELALVDVFTVVTVSCQDIPNLARALFLAGRCRDAELLTPRVGRARVDRGTVLFVLALQTILMAVTDVLLADAVVLAVLP